MDISKTLIEGVKEKNISSIHGVMYSIAHEDPGFKTTKFDNNLRYIEENYEGDIYVDDNGSAFEDKEKWTEDYWAEVVSELMDNFSKSRIEHLKEVGRYLYGAKAGVICDTTNHKSKVKDGYSKDNKDNIEWIKWGVIVVTGILVLSKLIKKGK